MAAKMLTTTTTLNSAQLEMARKYEALILQQLAVIGQRSVANALEVSDSTISRMKNGGIDELCRFLVALELQVVPESSVMSCPERLKALVTLARIGLDHEDGRQ